MNSCAFETRRIGIFIQIRLKKLMKHISLILTLIIFNSLPLYLHAQSEIVALPNFNSTIYCFDISHDSQTLYYPTGDKLIVYNIVSNEVLNSFDILVDSPVISIKIQDYGDYIFLGTKSGKVISVSIITGQSSVVKGINAGSITALAITSDGSLLLCGCENGMIYKHTLNQTNNFEEFYQHNGPITSIKVSEKMQLIAISSGDGNISLFKEPSLEHLNTLSPGKKWVRNVGFNDFRERLLCVGDEGKLYEWNLVDPNNIRLLNHSRVSRNWLLSLDIGDEGKTVCWGGLDHVLQVRTPYATYEKRLNGPLLKTQFIIKNLHEVVVACCILGKGIEMIPLAEMKYK